VDLNEVGEVIAVRVLSFKDRAGVIRKVSITVGKPQPFPNEKTYYCPFQISGAGQNTIKYAAGVDAVQSLQLVMSMIRANLESLSYELDATLIWEGGDQDDPFGFPLPASQTRT
jgi:hypothetical protein